MTRILRHLVWASWLALSLPLVCSAQALAIQGVVPLTAGPTNLTVADAGTCIASSDGCIVLNLGGYTAVSAQVTGTYSGTLQFEMTLDGTTWVAVSLTPPDTTTAVSSTTGVGIWSGTVLGQAFRVRASTVSSGTAVVSLRVSAMAARKSTGGGVGTVTSIATTSPITGGPITTTGTIACATCGVTGTGLSQFASTTSAELATLLSNETGTNLAVFNTAPTLVGTDGLSALTLTGGTVTASYPVINVTQTLNNAGVTFTVFKMNVTNTASAAASMLMDLQIGSTSIVAVGKGGQLRVTDGTNGVTFDAANAFGLSGTSRIGIRNAANSAPGNIALQGVDIGVTTTRTGFITDTGAGMTISFAASGSQLVTEGTHIIGMRFGTNAQTFNIYNTYTDASNYERGYIKWSSNALFIGNAAAGTGTTSRSTILGNEGAGSILFRVSATNVWSIAGANGHILAGIDNTYDIGASGATRPRNLYLAGVLTLAGGTLLTTSAALTDGAAAQLATITNGPTAGNPTKWIPINDNGTTRYIPAW